MIRPNEREQTALVVTDEQGQTVRLPEGFRIEGDRVRVRREGDRIVLEPVAPSPTYVHPDWPPGFWEEMRVLGPVSEEFEAAVREPWPESSYREQVIDD